MTYRRVPLSSEQELEINEHVRRSALRMDDAMQARVVAMWRAGQDTAAIGQALDLHEAVGARAVANRPRLGGVVR